MPFNERGQENLDKAKAERVAAQYNAGATVSESDLNFVVSHGYGGLLNTGSHSSLAPQSMTPKPAVLQAIETASVATPKPTATILDAIKAASVREPHGAEVGGSQLYATPAKEVVITLEPSFTTQPTDIGIRGQTIETKPMDINPLVETFVHAPSLIGVRGQTVETESMDVLVAKPEVTFSILQAIRTSRADILRGQGLELPPKSAAMALADYGVVGEAVGGFISPVENLVLLVGKFAKNPTMEKVMYNPTAFGVPVQAATSFFKGAVTKQPAERTSVDFQAQFLKEHPIYAGTSVIGDIFLGWVSGKAISEVGGKISDYWNRAYKGSALETSRIAKGTTVTPEGQTIYSGYAAKQASRLAREIVDVPGSNPLTHVSITPSGLPTSPELKASSAAWDIAATPHASAFLYTKALGKTLPTLAMAKSLPSELPLMGLVGGKLVEIHEAPAIATEIPTYKFSGGRLTPSFVNPSEALPFKAFGPSGALTTVDLTKNALASSIKNLPTMKDFLKSRGGEVSIQQLSRNVGNVSSFLGAFGSELALKSGAELLVSGASVLSLSALTSNKTVKPEPISPRPYVELVPKKLSSTILFPQITQSLAVSNKPMTHEEIEVSPSLFLSTMQQQKVEPQTALKTIVASYMRYSMRLSDILGEKEEVSPIIISGIVSEPISAQTPMIIGMSATKTGNVLVNALPSLVTGAPLTLPKVPIIPLTFPRLGGAGSGGGGRGGFGKWFKMTRPILEPKQVWKQFWGMPKLSVRRIGAKGKRSKVAVTRVGTNRKRSRKK